MEASACRDGTLAAATARYPAGCLLWILAERAISIRSHWLQAPMEFMPAPNFALDRRRFLVCGGISLISGCTALSKRSGSVFRLADVERELGGRLGLSAVNTANGARLYYRADERFAMCSSYKWILAAAVLARVDRNEIALDR